MRPAFVLFLVALAALAFWLERDRAPLGTADELKLVSDPASCAECHEKEVAAWRGSHHDLAMQHATEQTVLGDFGGAAFEHRGTTYRFFREGEGFRVGIGDATYAVPYTFGVDPLQQYLLDVGDGKLQALPVAWDVANRRWYAWYDEAFELGEPRFNWNHMCADCHSTYFRKAYDESARSYRSAWREIDVSCAACHPSVELHGGDPDDPFFLGVARSTSGADARNQHALDSCAQCHSRRAQFAEPLPRYAFLDAYEPSFITEPLYYPDGQIRDEVYVWGSFEQSKMKNAGVHCVDCHDPHSARLKHEGNAVCTECHRTDPPERFPTLKKRDYEAREHHRHEPGTRGSACIDCHMASRVYMGIDERHDHSFRIPRPDLTLAIGVPNACAKCHADKPASWAAETARTMGDGTAADQPHFGTAFATGDVEGLLRVAFGQAHPEIVAASAILRLGAIDDPRAREAVEEAARSELPLMRLAAIRAGARDVAELVPDGPLAVALAAAERAGILNAPRGRTTARSCTSGAASGRMPCATTGRRSRSSPSSCPLTSTAATSSPGSAGAAKRKISSGRYSSSIRRIRRRTTRWGCCWRRWTGTRRRSRT